MIWKSFEEFKPWMFIKNWITTKWKWIKEKHFNESKQFKVSGSDESVLIDWMLL